MARRLAKPPHPSPPEGGEGTHRNPLSHPEKGEGIWTPSPSLAYSAEADFRPGVGTVLGPDTKVIENKNQMRNIKRNIKGGIVV